MPVFLRLALLCLLLGLVTGCEKKSDPAEAAKTFFALIANGRSSEAYESTSLGFKAQQSEKRFAQISRELGLLDFLSMTSPPPKLDGHSAIIEAEVASREGKTAPLTISMVQERGAWRIFAVRSPRSVETGLAANYFGAVGRGAAFSDGQEKPMPTDAELRVLVESTLLLFNACVQEGSFDGLYEEIAKAWQDQLPRAKMQRAFQNFIDKKVDIGLIQNQTATFSEPPGISTEGLLNVRGFYRAQPANVLFSMNFMYQAPKWRLFGLDVSLAKASEE